MPTKLSLYIIILCNYIYPYNYAQNKPLNPYLLNFLNGLVHLQFLEQSIISYGDIKLKIRCWSANSIEPGQTAQMCRLAWLYTGGIGIVLSVPTG